MWTRNLPSDPLEAANLKHAVAFVLTETGLTLVHNQLTSFDQHQLVLNAAFKRAKSAPIMRYDQVLRGSRGVKLCWS